MFFAECAPHCSMCYNETECYECTQGFYLSENGECMSEYYKSRNKRVENRDK